MSSNYIDYFLYGGGGRVENRTKVLILIVGLFVIAGATIAIMAIAKIGPFNKDTPSPAPGAAAPDKRPPYAMGPAGTAKCPAGYEQITTEAEAKRAATSLGYKFASAGKYQQATIGALYNGYGVYFNTKAGGSTNSHHKSVCKLSADGK